MKFSALSTSKNSEPPKAEDAPRLIQRRSLAPLTESTSRDTAPAPVKSRPANDTEDSNAPVRAPIAIALFLTALWGLFCGLYAVIFPSIFEGLATSPTALLPLAITVFFPIVLIWCAVLVGDTVRSLRAEAADLRTQMGALKVQSSALLEGFSAQQTDDSDWIRKQLSTLVHAAETTDRQVAEINERTQKKRRKTDRNRGISALTPPAEDVQDLNQPALPLTGPSKAATAPITVDELLKAANFPDSRDDKEGFRVMRRASEDRTFFAMLTACQTLLTMMAQDGIYMDDLTTDPSDPDLWRRFAGGERTEATEALGVIRDRSALALIRNRMRVDAAFQEKAHNYLVKFMDILARFEPVAEDKELLELIETRSGKAFALLARVTGSFKAS